MTNTANQSVEAAEILTRLKAAGWKRTSKGEELNKAELEYDNGSVTLTVEQGSDPGWLDLSIFDQSDKGSDFSLRSTGEFSQLLDAIISFQNKISFTDYKAYLRDLSKVAEIFVDTGEDDFVPLIDDGGDA